MIIVPLELPIPLSPAELKLCWVLVCVTKRSTFPRKISPSSSAALLVLSSTFQAPEDERKEFQINKIIA